MLLVSGVKVRPDDVIASASSETFLAPSPRVHPRLRTPQQQGGGRLPNHKALQREEELAKGLGRNTFGRSYGSVDEMWKSELSQGTEAWYAKASTYWQNA